MIVSFGSKDTRKIWEGQRIKKLPIEVQQIGRRKLRMNKLANIHPGEVLLEEFLRPLEITAYRLSKDTQIPQTRVSQIIKGKRRITADTALRFSSYFGTTPKFWLGLQDDYDIEEERKNKRDILSKIKVNAPQQAI